MKYHELYYNRQLRFLLLICCIAGGLFLVQPAFAADASPVKSIDYTAHSAVKTGKATSIPDPSAADGTSIGELWQGDSSLTFNDVEGGDGGATTMTLSYANGDEMASTILSVNGETTTVDLPPTGGWSGGGAFKTVTVPIILKPGIANTIVFSASQKWKGWVFNKFSIPPAVARPFSLVASNSILNATLGYWPYFLILLLLITTIIVVKKQSEY